jgi:hypothetical protein
VSPAAASGDPERVDVIAVDWSGALRGERRKIWLAEVADGRLVRIEAGRDRAELVRHLVERAARGPLAVGLDFSFSLPAWFLREHGLATAPDLWQRVARDGERWIAACRPPFWGRPGRPRPQLDPERPPYRRTEGEALPVRGVRPKSTFQLGGAGSVGTGALRGMPWLLELAAAGLAVWPFDDVRAPFALEIYPRALTGAVVKTNRAARQRLLPGRFPGQDRGLLARAASSDDAFDAAVSALVMGRHALELERLEPARDAVERLEGRIWRPLRDPHA